MAEMTPAVIILFAATFANLALAGFIWAKQPRQEVNRIFALTAGCVALWTLTNALFQVTPSVKGAVLWAGLSYASALLLSTSVLHFSWVFPLRAADTRSKYLLWLAALALSVLSAWPGLVIDSVELADERRIVTTGWLYVLAAFLFGTLGRAFMLLWKSYVRSRGEARNQMRYVLLGMALTAACGLSANLLLPLWGDYRLVWLGPTSSLFFVSLTVYAIVTQRLFDIRLLLKRTLVYTLLLGGLIALYSAGVLFLTGLFERIDLLRLSPFAISLLSALGIGFGVEPLRRGLEQATDGFLFRRERAERRVVTEMALSLADVASLDDVLNTLIKSLKEVFHAERAAAFIFSSIKENGAQSSAESGSQSSLKRLRQSGFASTAKLMAVGQGELALYFEQHPHLLRVEQPNTALDAEAGKAAAKLQPLETALALPLRQNGRLVGLLLLGRKLSQLTYSPDDEALLEVLGTQALSAIQKALYYEGDQQKSEFVSIASHELLTPITAIEGYASMILDDDMGQVDEQARGYVSKIATSAHRLSTLLKDLLSVSRIEAGKLLVEPRAVEIEKLLEDTVDQLRFLAQDKGLTLSLAKPTKPLPTEQLPLVWADPDRMMQVLINLAGNAIKYTPTGSVTLSAQSLRPVSGSAPLVQVSIQDTGLGMSQEAQAHLFEKFYRVATPQTSSIQGTGLGLYITKALIEKMGGRLSLQSQEGQGSTFRFTVPVSPGEQAADHVVHGS